MAGDVGPFAVEPEPSSAVESPSSVASIASGSNWQNPDDHADVNDDSIVSAIDALLIINRLIGERPAGLLPERGDDDYFLDANGDQQLSASDAMLVVNALSRQATPWDTEEARVLADRMSGTLVAPDALVKKIAHELAVIRQTFPEFTDVTATPAYARGSLLLNVEPAILQSAAFRELNAQFDAEIVREWGDPERRWIHLRVPSKYNVTVLLLAYQRLQEVRLAQLDHRLGDPDRNISVSGDEYTFSRGAGDCPAGCIYRASWTFRVSGDTAELVRQSGDFPFPEPGVLIQPPSTE